MSMPPEDDYEDLLGAGGYDDSQFAGPTVGDSGIIKTDVAPWEMFKNLAPKIGSDAPATTPVEPDQPSRRSGASFSPDIESILDAESERSGVDRNLMRAFAKIESGGNPRQRTGSYKGLFQLSDDEFRQHGGSGDIYDPVANTRAAAAKLKRESAQFEKAYGRAPSAAELYMIHQQGTGGASAHWRNPDAPAWENMYATAEGREKGPNWAKQAIWGNIPNKDKRRFGSVDNVTSKDFIGLWETKVRKFSGDDDSRMALGGPRDEVMPTSSPGIDQSVPSMQFAQQWMDSKSGDKPTQVAQAGPIKTDIPPWEMFKAQKPSGPSAQPAQAPIKTDVPPWELAKKQGAEKAEEKPKAPEGFLASTYNALMSGYQNAIKNWHAGNADAAQRQIEAYDRIAKEPGSFWNPIKDQFGQEAVDEIRKQAREARAAAITGIAYRKALDEQYPINANAEKMMQAKSFSEGFEAFLKQPATIISSIGAQSLPQMVPALFAVAMTRNPMTGMAIMGGSSGFSEYASEITGAFEEAGIDLKDEKSVAAAFEDAEKMAEIRDKAFKKGAVVGLFDAASLGVASKTLLPAKAFANNPLARATANLAVQMPVQGTLGAAGEGFGSLAAGKEVSPGALMAEFFGEFAGAPLEVAALRNAKGTQVAARGGGRTTTDVPSSPVQEAAPQTPSPTQPQAAEAPAEQRDPSVPPPLPPSEQEFSVLRRMGYTPEVIAEMSSDQRAAELEDAKEMGLVPSQVPDKPTAEPLADLLAQARDLADPKNDRRGVYLSPDNIENIQANPEFVDQIAAALKSQGELVQNVDGNGGILLAKDLETAAAVRRAIESGQDIQSILGAVTGAGTGKDPNASAVVQQVTPEGAVTRESAVRQDQVAGVQDQFKAAGRDVRVLTPEAALARREQGLSVPPALPGEAVGDGSRQAPVKVQTADDVQRAAKAASSDYTPAQGEANNRKLGHAKWNGLDISIETEAGGVRRGVDKDGTPWESVMGAPYGYFRGSKGADNMHVDVFMGPEPQNNSVFVLDELDRDSGKFRQHKVFVGFDSEADARGAYVNSSNKSEDTIGGITEMSVDEFKDWLSKGKRTRPVSNLADRKPDTETDQDQETKAEQADTEADSIASEPLTDEDIEDLVKAWRYVNAIEEARASGREIQPKRLEIANEFDADLASYGIEFDQFSDEQALREYLGSRRGEDQGADAGAETAQPTEAEASPAEGSGRTGSQEAEVVQRQQEDGGREGTGADERPAEVGRPKRYEGDPLSPEDIDFIVAQWQYLREIDARPKPQSLTSFVIARGGLKDDSRDVRHIAGSAKERPGLINKNGNNLDDMALAAWEAGFLADISGDRPTINDLLDSLQDDLHTGMVVRLNDEPLLEDIKIAHQIAEELSEYGVSPRRFRTEETLREYFGQPRPTSARADEEVQREKPATAERKDQARPDQADTVDQVPFEAPETGPSDSRQPDPPTFADAKALFDGDADGLKKIKGYLDGKGWRGWASLTDPQKVEAFEDLKAIASQRAEPAKPAAETEDAPVEPKPEPEKITDLSKIFINVTVDVTDGDGDVSVRMSAKEALETADKRIRTLNALFGCVSK